MCTCVRVSGLKSVILYSLGYIINLDTGSFARLGAGGGVYVSCQPEIDVVVRTRHTSRLVKSDQTSCSRSEKSVSGFRLANERASRAIVSCSVRHFPPTKLAILSLLMCGNTVFIYRDFFPYRRQQRIEHKRNTAVHV